MDAFDRTTFPRAHTHDPRSSHEAAAEGERTGRFKKHAEIVLAALKRWPQATSAELARALNDPALDKHEVRRRLTDLHMANLVDQILPFDDTVPCEVSRKKVLRWIAR
jgi:predicted HTH transcriptional regulator